MEVDDGLLEEGLSVDSSVWIYSRPDGRTGRKNGVKSVRYGQQSLGAPENARRPGQRSGSVLTPFFVLFDGLLEDADNQRIE